jgi:hypothetical protein
MRSAATPKGMVIMRMNLISAAKAYPIAIHRPANTNQITLSSTRTSRASLPPADHRDVSIRSD